MYAKMEEISCHLAIKMGQFKRVEERVKMEKIVDVVSGVSVIFLYV